MDNIRCKSTSQMQCQTDNIMKSLDISGIQNAEKYISDILKKVGKHKLLKVMFDGNIFTLYFEGKQSESCNNIVKQGSKKKYQTMTSFMKSNLLICNERRLIGIFQTNTHYFLFFN